MNKQVLAMTVAILGLLGVLASDASAEEKFHKLTGSQIRAKVAGMEITDEAHWYDVYERSGTLTSNQMGNKKIGKWRVQKDQLCLDLKEKLAGCYEVWLSGKNIELRLEGSDSAELEGVLRPPERGRISVGALTKGFANG